MGWLTNVAEFEYSLSLSEADALSKFRSAMVSLENDRWNLTDETSSSIRGTCTTKLCRFVDDVTVTVSSLDSGFGCKVLTRSASRVGKGDMFKNKKNLIQLEKAANIDSSAILDKKILKE
eukprot:ANDGO_07720.mRNA.1 hypothetical protein GUITHDRAFT_162296